MILTEGGFGPGDVIHCLMSPTLCAAEVARTASGIAEVPGILQMIAEFIVDPFSGTIQSILTWMFSWLLVPSVDPENSSVVSTIMGSWMAPIVMVFLTCGIIWQGIQMTVSRKGAPLIRAVKGILATAIWGAIAAAGASALLTAGDSFSCWIIGEALHEPGAIVNGRCAPMGVLDGIVRSRVVDHFVNVLKFPTALFPPGRLLTTVLAMVMGLIIAVSALIQMFLAIVRGGSLLILVGVSQLAAAGTVTQATSGWLRRLIPWALALIFYKPVAAMVYATGLLLTDNGNEGLNTIIPSGADNSVRNFIFGVTIMLMAPFALPALMKFFTWGFSALGRDGTMAGAATGLDNIGDNLLRIRGAGGGGGGAGAQAQSINASLGVLHHSASGAGAGAGAGAVAGAGAGAASGARAAAVTSNTTMITATTTVAGGAAAAAPATGGTSLLLGAVALGGVAAATQIGTSLKRGITDHMDEDNQ